MKGFSNLYKCDVTWTRELECTLNLKKTTYTAFHPRQKTNSNMYIPLSTANQYLEQSSSEKRCRGSEQQAPSQDRNECWFYADNVFRSDLLSK